MRKFQSYKIRSSRRMNMEIQKLQANYLQDKACSFCDFPSLQIRFILKAAIIRLKRIQKERKFSEGTSPLEIDKQKVPIQRLLRVLFDKNKIQLKMSKFCLHLKLQNHLLEKLNCKIYQLQSLVDQLCDRIARRNYQLQIIATQVKNIQNTVSDQENAPYILKLQEKNNAKSCQIIQKESTQKHEEKIEEIQQLKILANEGSPPTNVNWFANLQSIPYAYNYLFYGGPFYQ